MLRRIGDADQETAFARVEASNLIELVGPGGSDYSREVRPGGSGTSVPILVRDPISCPDMPQRFSEPAYFTRDEDC